MAFSPDGRTLASGGEDYARSDFTIKLWDAASGRQLRALVGHSEEVLFVAFSPDGRTLASGSADTTIRLWDVATGRLLRTLAGHRLEVRSIAFAPDGRKLASGGDTIKLWDLASGRELRSLAEDDFNIESIAFSPDGSTLAAASSTIPAELWDVATGRRLRSFEITPKNNTGSHYVAFAPDGRTLASLSTDNTIKLWEVNTGRELRNLHKFTPPYSVIFSSDGRMLASGSQNNDMTLWDASSGRKLLELGGNASGPVAFSPDGHTLANGTHDDTIKLWDLESQIVPEQTDTVVSVAFSPDGRQLATACKDQSITLWDLASGHQLRTLSGDSIAFSPDGRILAVGGLTIQLWDAATGRYIQTLHGWGNSLAFSPDGGKLASGGLGSITLWDLASGHEAKTLEVGGAIEVTAVAFRPDGKELASASGSGIQLWDLATGKVLGSRPADEVSSVAFSPAGNTLVSTGKRVVLWNVADGSDLRTFTGTTATVLSVAFSPDGRILAGGSADSTIQLWDVASGRQLRTLGRPRDSVYSVAFSSDGKMLVSGGDTIRFWDVDTGHPLQSPIGENSFASNTSERQPPAENTARFNSVAISPDSRVIAAAGKDPTITLWDTATGSELRTLKSSGLETRLLVFSPDGSSLASGGLADTELWDVATGRVLRVLPKSQGVTESIVFSADGRILATGGFGKVSLWDVASGNELRSLEGDALDGTSVAFAPDGKTLASSGSRGIKLWDVTEGRLLRTLGEEFSIAAALVFSPDGSILASRGEDVKLWDLRSYHELRSFAGPTGTVLSASFSRDGRILAIANADGTIGLWDVNSGGHLHTLGTRREPVSSVAFSLDGKTLVSGGDAIKFWDVATASQPRTLVRTNFLVVNGRERQTLSGHTAEAKSIVLSRDGRRLAIAIADNKIQLWDLSSGKEPRTLAWPVSDAVDVALSPDGHTLAGIIRSKVQLWDAADGHELPSPAFEESESGFESITFSPNSQIVAVGGHNIRFWDISNGRELTALAGHAGKARQTATPAQIQTLIAPADKNSQKVVEWRSKTKHFVGFEGERQASVISLAFSSDGHTLATGGDDFNVKLWDLTSGHELRTLAGHSGWVRSVAFSADGSELASASDDLTVKLWDVGSGRELRTMEGHADRIMSVAFSPDGLILASGSDDGTVILWDVDSGRKLRMLPARAAVLSVAFAPDGRTLASGDKHAVRFWDTSSGEQLAALFALDEGAHWLVANLNGFFDTDNLDNIAGLSWVFPDEPLRALAPEVFMRDYFEPRLLARVLEGKALPNLRPLHDLNRAQPQVDLLKIEPEPRDGLVSVTVQVSSTQSRVQKDKAGRLLESGAYDLRLFRNGQLVAQWPEAETLRGRLPVSPDAERQSWQNLHRIDLTDGRYTRTFSHIRLPRRSGVDKVDFTAYAFNSDRVKSRPTPPYEYAVATTSATAIARRAYLVTVGVNANQSHNLDLELAVSSAERARSLFRTKLQAQYQEVVEVPLYSDLEPDTNRVRLKSASKADFKAVLDLLADRVVDAALREEVDPKHQLRPAGPDDAVVLYVASHGYADPQGTFYLMPYDTGSNWGITEDALTRCQTHPDQSTTCKRAQDLLGHLISSNDLTAWWNGVDAGEIVMILDSCHSGAAAGKEFRPGPLGDPGFGQLSYDKGMQILSASQPTQTEKGEWITGGEGGTLLVDALESVAGENPQQSLEQWLHGIEEQLPRMFKQLYPGLKDEDVQLPVLLDFAKRVSTVKGSPQE